MRPPEPMLGSSGQVFDAEATDMGTSCQTEPGRRPLRALSSDPEEVYTERSGVRRWTLYDMIH